MKAASIEADFDVPIEKAYAVLTDFENYSEFMTGTEKVTVLESSETSTRAEFTINMMKRFTYIIHLKHEKPNKISWTLESGDLFSVNSGNWELSDNADGTTHAHYSLEVDFKIKVPGLIVNKLVKTNLPNLMKECNKRMKEV